MDPKKSLKLILFISILGILFSGYLTLNEFGAFGSKGAVSCSATGGSCTTIIGLPVCVYGLAMYILVFVFSIIGLKK